jgi:hypothetical protein
MAAPQCVCNFFFVTKHFIVFVFQSLILRNTQVWYKPYKGTIIVFHIFLLIKWSIHWHTVWTMLLTLFCSLGCCTSCNGLAQFTRCLCCVISLYQSVKIRVPFVRAHITLLNAVVLWCIVMAVFLMWSCWLETFVKSILAWYLWHCFQK